MAKASMLAMMRTVRCIAKVTNISRVDRIESTERCAVDFGSEACLISDGICTFRACPSFLIYFSLFLGDYEWSHSD